MLQGPPIVYPPAPSHASHGHLEHMAAFGPGHQPADAFLDPHLCLPPAVLRPRPGASRASRRGAGTGVPLNFSLCVEDRSGLKTGQRLPSSRCWPWLGLMRPPRPARSVRRYADPEVPQALQEAHRVRQVGCAEASKDPSGGLEHGQQALRPMLVHVTPCVLFLGMLDARVQGALHELSAVSGDGAADLAQNMRGSVPGDG